MSSKRLAADADGQRARTSGSRWPLGTGTHRVVAGVLNWFSVGAAVGAVALLAEVPSLLAWALGSLVATLVYLVGASVQLAFVAGRGTQ